MRRNEGLPREIVGALSQFPRQEFCARDIGRRFREHPQAHVLHTLRNLAEEGQLRRRMRYGVYYYAVAA